MFASNQTVQRARNRTLVLRSIYDARRISRVDLSRFTGLMKSSITNIVNELITAGLVVEAESGVAGTSGGRKPVYLTMNPGFCCFLGLELQHRRFRAVVLDLNGNVLLRQQGVLPPGELSFEYNLHYVYDELAPSLEALGVPLRGVSVGIPGHVDPKAGIVYRSIPHGLVEYDIKTLDNPWGIPIDFENDAKCCAWAELIKQGQHSTGDFMAVLLEFQEPNRRLGQDAGISIGFGLVLNGQVYYGKNGEVGEFKSLNWRRNNRSQLGISDASLSRMELDPSILPLVVDELLENLTPLSSILAPDRIVLCGEGPRLEPLVRQSLEGALRDSFMALHLHERPLVVSAYGEDAVAMGAAGKLLISLFNGSNALYLNPRLPSWEDLLEPNI